MENQRDFRAPSFSLNDSSSWVIDSLEKNGYMSMTAVLFQQKQVCMEFQMQR